MNSFLFGHKLKKIGEELISQTSQILNNTGSKWDKRSIPVLITLIENGVSSINELASSHGMTHPAIVQVVNKLAAKGFISVKKSKTDKRKTLVEISKKGRAEMNKIDPIIERIGESLNDVINLIDSSLPYSIKKLEKAVRERLLLKTISEKLGESASKELRIIPFDKKYKVHFRRLNYEWLKKYFVVEDEDERILNNPEREIINKGGEIFFALLKDKVVGTVAVCKLNPSTYELSKMAVTEEVQGKQIGKKLALTSIGFAVDNNAERLVLSTNVKLTAAINLYKSLGFEIVPNVDDYRYKRELIYMELNLVE